MRSNLVLDRAFGWFGIIAAFYAAFYQLSAMAISFSSGADGFENPWEWIFAGLSVLVLAGAYAGGWWILVRAQERTDERASWWPIGALGVTAGVGGALIFATLITFHGDSVWRKLGDPTLGSQGYLDLIAPFWGWPLAGASILIAVASIAMAVRGSDQAVVRFSEVLAKVAGVVAAVMPVLAFLLIIIAAPRLGG